MTVAITSAAARFAVIATASAAAAVIAAGLSNLPLKGLLIAVAAVSLVPLGAITREAKLALIVTWILSLGYFRVIFPIPSMAGFQGFYVNIHDAVFLGAMLYWFFEAAVLKKSPQAQAPPNLFFIVPLVLVAFVSALQAERTDWAMYEVIRLAKLPLMMIYCRYNFSRREWWFVIAALGFSMIFQSAYGLAQVRGWVGNYQLESWDAEARANGLLAHASLFSGYMLLLTPLMATMAIVLRPWWAKLLCGGAAAAGILALVLAKSRMPWLITVVEFTLLAAALAGFRLVSLKRVLGGGAIVGVIAGIGLLFVLDRLQARIQSDFNTAVDWRVKMMEIGVDIWQQRPFVGIGLANFPLYLRDTNINFGDSLEDALAGEFTRAGLQGAKVEGFHWVWVTHNLYILLMAETGALGLLAFLWFLTWAARGSLRSIRVRDERFRAVTIGASIGMLGLLGMMMTDWALWLDPLLYTFTIVGSLLNNLPKVAADQMAAETLSPAPAAA